MNVPGPGYGFHPFGTTNYPSPRFFLTLLASMVLSGISPANAGTGNDNFPPNGVFFHHQTALNAGFHVAIPAASKSAQDLVFVTLEAIPSNAVRLAQGGADYWAINNGRRSRRRVAPAPRHSTSFLFAVLCYTRVHRRQSSSS